MDGPNATVRVWFGGVFLALILICGITGGMRTLRGATSQTSVQAGNALPTASGQVINNGSAVVLTAGTTTVVRANFVVSDNNGCGDVFFSGQVTTTLYRTGISSSCSANTLNCYVVGTTTHNCPFATTTQVSANVTTTFLFYYFADATDASSSYSADRWGISIRMYDASGTQTQVVGGSTVELNTLLAIEAATSSLDYGTVTAGTDTGSTNQTVGLKNSGNASTSLDISGTALRRVSDLMPLPTSSQHYASTTFTYGGLEQLLSGTAQAVSGFLIPRPVLGQWATSTLLPEEVFGQAAFARNNFLYNFGGAVGSQFQTTTVLFAPLNPDGSIGSWTTSTPLLFGLRYAGAAVYENFAYVLGGSSGESGTHSSTSFATINATGSIGSWAYTTSLPSALGAPAALAHKGYLYAIGGATTTVLFAPINATGSLGSWATTTPLPIVSSFAPVAIYRDFIYLVGGTGTGTSTVWYAPMNSTGSIGAWSVAASLPGTITQSRVVADNGVLYSFGGTDPSSFSTSTVYFAPILGNGSLGSWSLGPSLLGALQRIGGGVNNGFFYEGGGQATNVGTTTTSYISLASRNTYWGLSVPGGTPFGTYTGTNTFTVVFSP